MSSGIEIPTSGRLFQASIQSTIGRLWRGIFGTPPVVITRPDIGTVEIVERQRILTILSRTVTLEVIE